MNRRDWLKLVLSGVAGLTLDPEKLLWVPGQKKILIPSRRNLTYSQIVNAEWERMIPYISDLFERDNIFYTALADPKKFRVVSSREMRIPLIIEPGRQD